MTLLYKKIALTGGEFMANKPTFKLFEGCTWCEMLIRYAGKN